MESAAPASVLRKVSVNLTDLADAFDDASWEIQVYLNLDTGEVIHITHEMAQDPEVVREVEEIAAGLGTRYLQLPHADSRAGYTDMRDFVATVADPHLEEQLGDALRGRGAFRRFKDVLLGYPQERERWFVFKQRRQRERACAWLAEEGIAPIGEED